MLHKRHNSVVTLFLLLALVGVSKPAKAFLLAQSETAPTTFSLPDKLPQDAEVQIAASNSTTSINESLTESFSAKYPKAQVNIETQDSNSALKSLSEGKADLVSIGRTLTPEEKAEGFVEVPISREKIAIVISKNNSYDGNLTITQFAQIFRGEITDWSEIDGAPGKIKLVDMPDSNDTRQAFPNYPVFQSAEFITGSDTVQLEEDSTDAMIAQLGASGIGYAVANDVIDRDDVQIVTMHQTKPDNPKYPFSQPFSLVYQGTPSEAAKAYLGFATADGGEEVIASRVGSLSTAAAIASGLATSPNVNNSETTDAPQSDADADVDATDPDVDVDADVDATDPDAVADADVDVDVDVDVDATDPDAVADADADVDATDPDAVADADADVDATDPDAVADADADVDVDATDPDVVADADVDVDATDPDVVADADVDVDATDPDVIADADADVDVDATDPDVIADADVDVDATDPDAVADADVDVDATDPDVIADADIEGSGEINPEIDGSGEINPEIDGSGEIEINPEVDGSGELNPDLQESGSLNPNVEGSGEINPEIDGSGEPLSSENLEIDGETTPDVAIADGEVTAPNTVEGVEGETSGAQTIAKKGEWWKWLPLILGLPLLVLGAIFALGGRKKSDQEPAISNVPNPDAPNGGIGLAGGADGGDMSAIGANISGKAGNAVGTTSKLGNTAIATGGAALAGGAAAAANLVGGKKSVENNTDIDLDLDESGGVTEIPSNSVTEFTDQETKLQTDVNDNLNNVSSGLTNDISAGVTGLGAAAVGGVAAVSGFLGDSETSTEETTADFVVEDESSTNIELDTNVSELQTDQTTDLVDRGSKEFTGDFVLQEENKSSLVSEQDTDLNVSGINVPEVNVPEVDVSGINSPEVNVPEVNVPGIEVPDVNTDVNLDLTGKVKDATEGISGAVSGAVDGIKTPELDLPDIDVNLSGDKGTGIVDRVTESGGAALAGGAAALGGAAAAASGFFNRNQDNQEPVDAEFTSEQDTDLNVSGINVPGINVPEVNVPEIDTPELNTDINLDLTGKATDVTEGISGAVSGAVSGINVPEINVPEVNVPEIDTPELNTDVNLDLTGKATDVTEGISGAVSDAVDGIKTPELDLPDIDVNLSGDKGTGIVDRVTESGGAALAGGAAALGGAAAAASGFFNRNQDNQEPVDAEFTSEQDTDLNVSGIDVPGIDVPEVNVPEVNVPGINVPEVNVPGINVPEVNVPEINVPEVNVSGINAPEINVPEVNVPGINVPEVNVPEIDTPELNSDINLDLTGKVKDATEGVSGAVTGAVGGIKTPELDLPNIDVDLSGDTGTGIVDRVTESGGAALAGGAAALGGAAAAASGFFNRNQDNQEPVDAEFTSELNDVDISLETSSSDGDISLEDITLDDTANMPEVSLEEITLDDETSTSELSLDEIAFNDADTRINASLEEITFDDGTNTSELSLDEIALDTTETKSTTNQNINLDDLGFEESANGTTSDLLSNNAAEITSLSDDQSNDMNNISEWLDSLETPTQTQNQSTDNISEWLDTLNTDNVDSVQKGNDQETTADFSEEADDISFKFLEDLLDRDSNPKQDNQ